MVYSKYSKNSKLQEILMNIIIAGGGKIGSALAFQLASEGYDVTVIDTEQEVIDECVEKYDVMGIKGNCASMQVLLDAGIENIDLLIAVTGADELNLLCCTTAHGLNPKLHTIARIRNPEYTEQIFTMRSVFGLSMAVNPERQTAVEIARLLKYPGFLHRDTFAKGRTEIVELKITSESKLCNVPLFEMNTIVKCKVLVCAVIRDGKAVTPKGNFILEDGDRIFVTAPTENLTILLNNLGIITRKVRRVMICGGGRISYYLADMLVRDGMDVRIIENDEARCRELCTYLPEVTVIHGDGTDQELLDSEGLDKTDALVSLTGIDELNMVISLYAGVRGVPHVITNLDHIENQNLINDLELGSVIRPKALSSNNILRYVRAMQNQSGAAVSVHIIADGQVEAIEFAVDDTTQNCGKQLKDIKLHDDVLIVGISHGSQTEIPSGNSKFDVGDTIVIVTGGKGKFRQLNDIFA